MAARRWGPAAGRRLWRCRGCCGWRAVRRSATRQAAAAAAARRARAEALATGHAWRRRRRRRAYSPESSGGDTQRRCRRRVPECTPTSTNGGHAAPARAQRARDTGGNASITASREQQQQQEQQQPAESLLDLGEPLLTAILAHLPRDSLRAARRAARALDAAARAAVTRVTLTPAKAFHFDPAATEPERTPSQAERWSVLVLLGMRGAPPAAEPPRWGRLPALRELRLEGWNMDWSPTIGGRLSFEACDECDDAADARRADEDDALGPHHAALLRACFPGGGGGGGGAGLAGVTVLTAEDCWLDRESLGLVLDRLPGLRRLEFDGSEFVPVLLSAARYGACEDGGCSAAAAVELIAARAPRLEALSAGGLWLDAAAAAALARLPRLRALEAAAAAACLPRLRLLEAHCPCGDWRGGAAGAAFPRVVHAELLDCEPGFAGVRVVDLFPSLEHLCVAFPTEELDRRTPIAVRATSGGGGEDGLTVDLSGLTGLRSLELYGISPLGPCGWAALAAMPRLLRLACSAAECDAAGGGGGAAAGAAGGGGSGGGGGGEGAPAGAAGNGGGGGDGGGGGGAAAAGAAGGGGGGGGGGGAAASGGLAKLLGAAAGSIEYLDLDVVADRPPHSDGDPEGAAAVFDLAALLAAAAALPRLRALLVNSARAPRAGGAPAAALARATALTALRLAWGRPPPNCLPLLLGLLPEAAPLRELYLPDSSFGDAGAWADAAGACAARGLALRRAREWAAGPGAARHACGWRPYRGNIHIAQCLQKHSSTALGVRSSLGPRWVLFSPALAAHPPQQALYHFRGRSLERRPRQPDPARPRASGQRSARQQRPPPAADHMALYSPAAQQQPPCDMMLTDAELEDFLSFMDHPPGGAAAAGASARPKSGGGGGSPLRGPAAAAACSSGAYGGAGPHGGGTGGGWAPAGAPPPWRDDAQQRSPSSSTGDCTAALKSESSGCLSADGFAAPLFPAQHAPPPHAALLGYGGLGAVPEGEAYAPPPAAAAVPVPPAAPRRAGAPPPLALPHAYPSLDGLALASPGGGGPPAAPPQQFLVFSPGALPQGAFCGGGGGGGGGAGVPLMSMGAFGGGAAAHGLAFVPAALASGPRSGAGGGAPTLASTLDGGASDGSGVSAATAAASPGAGTPLAAARRRRHPLLWRRAVARAARAGRLGAARARGGGGAAAAAAAAGGCGDATYHRGSGAGGGALSHSTIEKQRRDRLNALLDELGALVPPPCGRQDGGRRPKHLILSDAIALLAALRGRVAAGEGEAAALRAALAGAEARAAAGGGGGGGAAGAIDIAEPRRGAPAAAGSAGSAGCAGSGGGSCGGYLSDTLYGSSAPAAERLLLPHTPCGSPPPAPAGPRLLSVEQEGARVRVRAARGAPAAGGAGWLLQGLAAAAAAAGAEVVGAAAGPAYDELELSLAPGAGAAGLEALRAALLGALSGAGPPAPLGGAPRGKRSRQ
ncbi:MAG: hypothetical protein J3K34DRAFT_502283 [Monoraphidium minutum]|nr:MAG: hypothetical protein J3K34DRAFT_502283 [Monoraphidium minutum]